MKVVTCLLFNLIALFLFAQTEKGVKPVDQPSSGNTQSQTYAVVVGISDYQDPAIPDLRFADRDAEAFASWLHSPAGGSVPTDNIRLLLNEEATAGQLNASLGWLLEKTKEGDQAVIYFSGHGDMNANVLNQLGFLLLWDSPPHVYFAGALPVDVLKNLVTTLSTENKAKVLVVADACRAGKLASSDIIGSQLTNANLAKQFANEQKILSCQADEYSIEGEQWGGGRGVFSWHLINGLYGLADRNNDHKVTLLEIDHYLQDKVLPEVAPLSQIPITVGDKTDVVGRVDIEVIDNLNKGDASSLVAFSNVEQRGLVQEILAKTDTNIVSMYRAFQLALEEKRFLETDAVQPDRNYAEVYYQNLLRETKISPLHSSLTRSYAAALQDDAQQALNRFLKDNSEEYDKSYVTIRAQYQHYPRYLRRAAELLGPEHYMHDVFLARSYWLEGFIASVGLSQKKDTYVAERQEVMTIFHQALKYQRIMPPTWINLADLHGQLLQFDSMEYYGKLATDHSPKWIWAYSQMGFTYLNVKGKDKKKKTYCEDRAKYWLDQGLQTDSNSLIILDGLAYWYHSKKRYEEEIATLDRAIAIDSLAKLFQYKGYAYRQLYRYDESEEAFLQAIELDSTRVADMHGLQWLYHTQGKKGEIAKLMRKAISMDPDNGLYYAYLGAAVRATQGLEKARPYLEKAMELDSLSFLTTYQVVGAYSDFDYQKGLEITQGYLNVDPENEWAITSVGAKLRRLGRFEESEKHLLKFRGTNGPFNELGENLCAVSIALGKYEDALKYIDEALNIPPNSRRELANRGLALWALGRYEESEKSFLKSISPGFSLGKTTYESPINGHFGLAVLYMDQQKESAADSLLDLCLTKSTWRTLKLTVNYFTRRNGDPEVYKKGCRFFDKLKELRPDHRDISFAYARLHGRYGYADKGLLEFEQALQKGWDRYIDLHFYDLDPLKAKTEKWNELKERYFPEE